MPRRGRSKRKISSDEEETLSDAAVANVNKSKSVEKRKRKTKKIAKTCTQEALMTDDSEPETLKTPVKKGKKKTVKIAEPEQHVRSRSTTEADIQQDNQILTVTVDNSQELVSENEEMSEAERNFVQLDAEDSEDGEITFNEEEANRGQMSANVRKSGTNEIQTSQSMNNRERIRQIDAEMSEKIKELHKLMNDGGLTESANLLKQCLPKEATKGANAGESHEIVFAGADQHERDNNQNCNANIPNSSQLFWQNQRMSDMPVRGRSLETIYDSAVPRGNRNSSSSEEEIINTSDELDKNGPEINALISEIRERQQSSGGNNRPQPLPRNDRYHYTKGGVPQISQTRYPDDEVLPSTSDGRGRPQPVMLTSEEKADKIVREAEISKARIFATPGKDSELFETRPIYQQLNNACALIDEGFVVVGAHLDDNMVEKIVKGDYVDFSKLLPRDRVMAEEDGRLEMIIKNGRTYWAPVNPGINITNFSKWEQAFRVYSNVYTKHHPSRAAELIEYNHVIHTIASHYIWENVYLYDKDFRLHMSRNPARSWAIILQQAWSLRLRDRLMTSQQTQFAAGAPTRGRLNEPCRRFNRGRCNYGSNCKYEHRCNYCNKFGHGSVNCRKAIADRGNFNNNPNPNPNGNGGGNKKPPPHNGANGDGASNNKPIQVSNN